MKKLKFKVFLTILSILTLFLITILFIFHYQDYQDAKSDIERNLMILNEVGFNRRGPSLGEISPNITDSMNEPGRFLDATIYSVLLDDSSQIVMMISHTPDSNIPDDIVAFASDISTTSQTGIHIGNLYFDNYSYRYDSNHIITILDQSDIKDNLWTSLQRSVLLFGLLEAIIILIATLLSKWIITPVLESFNRQKQFIADASHELKTPLTVIMASADALEDDIHETRWLENIKEESHRMSKLVVDLLDLAKLEDETLPKQYQRNDLSKIVKMAILTLESLMFEQQIELDYSIDKGLMLTCNDSEIKQLVMILLDNAIKHSVRHGKIIVSLKEQRNLYHLIVKNKGDAIPKGEEEKIFERFYRVDKARSTSENRYGLGLAIAKGIVENYGGSIKAYNENEMVVFQVVLKKNYKV